MKVSASLSILFNVSLWSSAHSFSTTASVRSFSVSSEFAVNRFRPYDFSLQVASNPNDLKASVAKEPEESTVELTEVEIELLSRKLKDSVDFPYLPNFVEKQIIKTALTSFCKIAPLALPGDLFRDLITGSVDWNDIKEDVIQDLNDEICIPIVSRQVQDQIVDTICTVMFTSNAEKQEVVVKSLRSVACLDCPDAEEEFATMLNGMIDIPLMNEEQEQKVALKLAGTIRKAFETMVPEEVREILSESSPEELQEARQSLIDRLNEKIDIPLKSEQEERKYFAAIVDFLLKKYGLSKDTMLPEEELVDIARTLDILEVEIEVQEELMANKLGGMRSRMESLLARKALLESKVSPIPYFAQNLSNLSP
jgi:hypothetical protein